MAKRLPRKRTMTAGQARKKRRGGGRSRWLVLIVSLAVLIPVFLFMRNRIAVLFLSARDYPASLIRLAKDQPEALSFVRAYQKEAGGADTVDVSEELDGQGVPLFIQWDRRWGYAWYGEDYLALTGCGPTCLSMVYCYLTGDGSLHPGKMAEWAQEKGFYAEGVGTSWDLMSSGAEALGLSPYTTSLTEEHLLNALSLGRVIICSVGYGDFTKEGHFIVLAGVTENGKIKINDPNSLKRSEKEWDIGRVLSQIKQFWIY